MQIDLDEQELEKLMQLVAADMVAEDRKQPPHTDFTYRLHPLAAKLHAAREAEIMRGRERNKLYRR